ncbi:unnamed protein product [Urochloa humidicola]
MPLALLLRRRPWQPASLADPKGLREFDLCAVLGRARLGSCSLPVLGYLDENNQLILAILENQNLGIAESTQYQTQLQKNLMYLALIVDA